MIALPSGFSKWAVALSREECLWAAVICRRSDLEDPVRPPLGGIMNGKLLNYLILCLWTDREERKSLIKLQYPSALSAGPRHVSPGGRDS